MQELNRHMQDQLDHQRDQDIDLRNRDFKRLEEYKNKVSLLCPHGPIFGLFVHLFFCPG